VKLAKSNQFRVNFAAPVRTAVQKRNGSAHRAVAGAARCAFSA
jgi:hypothetical protein